MLHVIGGQPFNSMQAWLSFAVVALSLQPAGGVIFQYPYNLQV